MSGMGGFGESSAEQSNALAANPRKPSKKAVLVGVEYEALLQSALEDQAMFFEGEIAKITSELMASLVDNGNSCSPRNEEVEILQVVVRQYTQ